MYFIGAFLAHIVSFFSLASIATAFALRGRIGLALGAGVVWGLLQAWVVVANRYASDDENALTFVLAVIAQVLIAGLTLVAARAKKPAPNLQ